MNAPAAPAPGLVLLDWKPVVRNTLRGFATVQLRNGLTVHDVVVHTTHNRAWAALPSKPMLGRSGTPMRDSATNKIRYVPILEWPDKETANRFSAAVVSAIEAQYPGATSSTGEVA